MHNLTPHSEEIMDAEICEQHFPGTAFIAQVHKDAFSDSIFEFYLGEEADQDEYIELILGDTHGCGTIHTCDGEVVFVHKETNEITYTHETNAFLIEDVTVIFSGREEALEEFQPRLNQ